MKIVCEVCGNKGYLQHLAKNYYRVRHYDGLDQTSKKPRFEYHKQSLGYVEGIFEQSRPNTNIDLIDPRTIDPNSLNMNSNSNKNWSLGRASVPRPPPYQGGAPPG